MRKSVPYFLSHVYSSPAEKEWPVNWSLIPLGSFQSKIAPHALFTGLVDMLQESELPSPLPVASCQRPLSQAQLLSVRLGGSTDSALLSSMQGEGIENFTLHNQSSTNKPDTLPKLVQFSVCMLYSSEPLGQGEERSSKGEDSRVKPHPGLPTITPRLRYAEGQISSWRKTPFCWSLP